MVGHLSISRKVELHLVEKVHKDLLQALKALKPSQGD
jgi:hypothetical protein